jgi:Spy/CpxP family protein refolding chaperone
MNNSWKVVVAFFVVFLFGGAIGAVGVLRFWRPAVPPPSTPPAQFGWQLMRRWVASNQLDLTAEQKAKIRPIVFETAESLRRLRRDTLYSEQVALEHMQDQISALLTPEQRAKFAEMIEVQRTRMRRYIQQQQWRSEEQQRRLRPTAP